MMKRARIAVDCYGEIRRTISPLKSGFPDAGWFGMLYKLNETQISGVLEVVSCDRVEWAYALVYRHQSEVHQFLTEFSI